MRISSAYFSSRLAADYLRKQSELSVTQGQLASGKKIRRPSDDPAVAAVSSSLKQSSRQFAQFDRNSTFAEARLSIEETTLASVSNVLVRMKELALAVNNDTLSPSDNVAYLTEVQQQLAELLDYANIADSNGDFLFAGSNVGRRPFVGSENVVYQGDDGVKNVQIGTGRTVASSDSGTEIFLKIKSGSNGLVISAADTNTGTGRMSSATILDKTVYEKHQYDIVFTAPTTFDIIDINTGATVLGAQTYTPGQQITFAGMETTISGNPQAGDTFTIQPSYNQDLFTTVNNFIDILSNEPTNDAEKVLRKQNMDSFLRDLNQAFEHINSKRSAVGTRLVYIDNSRDENLSIKFQIDTTISGFEDLDYAEAVTRMESQLTSLEALQRSFARIESLSLFDII